MARQREVTFRPRARLVSVLGEQLIGDQAVGLIELVKNAYDADATKVEVVLEDLGRPESTTVVIRDNGSGMTLKDVEEKWLSPAVSHKDQAKHDKRRTPKGRLPIGEKGVGRFAVHQLGRRLELVTRAKGCLEVVLPVDWDRFDAKDAYLDSLSVSIEERDPEVFSGNATGTLLRISLARSQWTRPLVEKVQRTLRRLQSPVQDDAPDFTISLKCPDFPDCENINPSDILDRAHYQFRALVDEKGHCDFEYSCKHPALPPKRKKPGSENLVPLALNELQGELPQCGPFWLHLYVWDRTRDFLAQSGVPAKELSAMSGVSVFRDGLRILPYGEPGDDWLLLDQERIQDPSGRIGNNQVIGLVDVFQKDGLKLKDKTNREGLIENEAFRDLRAMVRAAIRLFTASWKKDRPKSADTSVRRQQGSLEAAKGIATALRATASDEVKVSIPGPAAGEVTPEAAPPPSVVSQKQALDVLINNIEGAEQSAKERERKLERIAGLAATGLAAERVVHEFGRQVTAALEALSEIRRGTRKDDSRREALSTLEACLGTLRNEFRILAPYDAAERSQKSAEISVRECSELATVINRRPLELCRAEATISGKDFRINGRTASLVQVIDNIVHNSCYWLSTLGGRKSRRIHIEILPEDRRILIADSGPGVHPEARPHLFEPFFTMKSGGTGLGLYISREVLRHMGGRIELAEDGARELLPEWATGAAFVIQLPAAKRG